MNSVVPCVKLVIEEEGKLNQEPVFLQWNSDGLRGGGQCGRGKDTCHRERFCPCCDLCCDLILPKLHHHAQNRFQKGRILRLGGTLWPQRKPMKRLGGRRPASRTWPVLSPESRPRSAWLWELKGPVLLLLSLACASRPAVRKQSGSFETPPQAG